MHACIRTYVCVCAYIYIYVYTCVYIYIYIYTCVRVCLHANVCMCLCRYLNVRVCVYIYMSTSRYYYIAIMLTSCTCCSSTTIRLHSSAILFVPCSSSCSHCSLHLSYFLYATTTTTTNISTKRLLCILSRAAVIHALAPLAACPSDGSTYYRYGDDYCFT